MKNTKLKKLALEVLNQNQPIFSADSINKEEIKNSILAPYVTVTVSMLGGTERASIMITLSLDDKKDWTNGILQNSRYMYFSLSRTGVLEQFNRSGAFRDKKFRKTKAVSVEDAINKINKYLLIVVK